MGCFKRRIRLENPVEAQLGDDCSSLKGRYVSKTQNDWKMSFEGSELTFRGGAGKNGRCVELGGEISHLA